MKPILINLLVVVLLISCQKDKDNTIESVSFEYYPDNSSTYTPNFNYNFLKTDSKGNISTTGNNVPGGRQMINNFDPKTMWDFGDGTNSVVQNPYHIWNKPGTYTVKLTVRKSVNFVTTSNSDNVLWDFGDGSTSTEKNPIHIFSPGIYTVKLTVNDKSVTKTITINEVGSKSLTVTLNENEIVDSRPDFLPLTSSHVNFIGNLSTGITTSGFGQGSYLWNFGDGSTSTMSNPGHTYNIPGTYTVKLTVTGWGGFNKSEKSIQILIR